MNKVTALLIPFLFAFTGVSQATVLSIGNVGATADKYNLSTWKGANTKSIEAFVGLSQGTLNSLSTGKAKRGSAIKDSFWITAGDIFTFDWKWDSKEANGSRFNDFSFVSLSLDGSEVLADTYTADKTTGRFSWTATTTGEFSYGIGVMDVNDRKYASTLAVSNINLVSIPEPALLGLLGLALAGLSFRRRNKKA